MSTMGWQQPIFLYPTFLATVVAAVFAFYGAVRIRDRGSSPVLALFFWLSVCATVWTFFSALKLANTDPDIKFAMYRLLHVGAAGMPPLLFLFALAYTDRTSWLRPSVVSGVFAVPVVFLGLLFLDPGDVVVAGRQVVQTDITVVRVDDGPGFLLFGAYSTILTLAAAGMIATEALRLGGTYYAEATLLLLGVLAPMVISVFTTAEIPPFTDDSVNLVPASAGVSVALVGTAIFRYRLLELPPIAYTTAIEESPDSIFVLDSHGQIVHANERGEQLLSRFDTAPGEPVADAFPASEVTRPGTDSIQVTADDGTPAYFDVRSRQLDRYGEQVGWVVVLRDLTELYRQKQTIEAQNERLDEFAGIISHDLRNPLAVARGNVELARQEHDSDRLDTAGDALNRMDAMIDDMLKMARAGKATTDTEPVGLTDAARQAWQHTQTDGSQLELAVRDSTTVEADDDKLFHIFENFFRNAIDHNDPPLTVRVGTLDDTRLPNEESGGFFVEDDGTGLPTDESDRLFERGYTTRESGNGVGLFIVRELVEAHGWTVTPTEGRDGGARFEIRTGPGGRAVGASHRPVDGAE
ncbi:MAG: histidine kinase N-terminal 7TM domain-containing protein [Halovenus sp.]